MLLCGGLMTGLTLITWLRFVVWLGLGLLIYFFYSRHRSEFAKTAEQLPSSPPEGRIAPAP
jgi:basic amino acid/polyamine antiporter, APA family